MASEVPEEPPSTAATAAERPLISADLHVEAGTSLASGFGSRPRRDTIWARKSRIIFDKIINGKYKQGETGYKAIGVLLITWEIDTYSEAEVTRLQRIFEKQFGYAVRWYRIPSERSSTGLAKALADFAHEYDGPDKMAIVYYGGHGDNHSNGRFGMYAKDGGDGDGDPYAFVEDAMMQLKLPDTDILTIIDCCYAARAFSHSEIGRRKFELLASTPPSVLALGPNRERSFTKSLCDSLEHLLKDNSKGFTTSKLYHHVYFKQDDERKPLLFDQSACDYGKIWLRPFKTTTPTTNDTVKVAKHVPHAMLTLKLKLTEAPNTLMMNQLATAMQYLPHVEEVSFQELYAPLDELQKFILLVRQTSKLRPVLAKLRERRLKNVSRDTSTPRAANVAVDALQSAFHTTRRDSKMYDWSNSRIDDSAHPSGPKVTSAQRTESPMNSLRDQLPLDQPTHDGALTNATLHHIGPWLGYRYAIDTRGLRKRLGLNDRETGRRRAHITKQDVAVSLSLALLLLVCFCITRTGMWKDFCD